jgi:hypothetical protein
MRPPLRSLRALAVFVLALALVTAVAGVAATAKHRTHHRGAHRRRRPRPQPSDIPPPEPAPPPPALPRVDFPVVFVSRAAVPGDPTAVPGLGPHHRAAITGGRLMVRDVDGRTRELLPPGSMFDVSDPAVAFDGARIAFAGVRGPGERWRIWLVRADGSALQPVTQALPGNGDDLDPCWIADHWLAFASTRDALTAEYGDVPATNLWLVREDGALARRVTAERNGAEEPALDPLTGRLLYARWWTNRHRPSNVDRGGLTTVGARALGDSINLWQVVSVTPDSSDVQLAAGDPRSPRGEAAYQPCVLANGAVAAVNAVNLAMSPRPGGLALEVFGLAPDAGFGGLPRAIGEGLRVAGAVAGASESDPYHEARGLSAPAACAPAALPGGGMVFAYDPGARGDFGLWIANDDGRMTAPLVDLPGTLELDPAPLVARHPHLVVTDSMLDALPARDPAPPAVDDRALARASDPGFTFHDLDVFASAPLDTPLPPPPPPTPHLTVRFFAALARPGTALGDTAVLVREAPVLPGGEVRADHLPAGVPLFEQVVDSLGHVLMSAHGPAHVPGFNPGGAGERRCIGCHAGHSAIPVPGDADEAAWFDAAPSAAVTATGTAAGYDPAHLVDRRTRGAAQAIGWSAEGADAVVTLRFPTPLVVREVALYGLPGGSPTLATIALVRDGVALARASLTAPADPAGTHTAGSDHIADGVQIELHAAGRSPRHAAALAEIEVIARIP